MPKSPWKHFYPNFLLIKETLSWKTSLLVRSEILGLFGNTLTDDHMYSRRSLREISGRCSNATIWKTKKILSIFYWVFEMCRKFCAVLKKRSVSDSFWKKDQLYSLNISEVIVSKKCGYLNAEKGCFRTLF